jgi:hypothetical protein
MSEVLSCSQTIDRKLRLGRVFYIYLCTASSGDWRLATGTDLDNGDILAGLKVTAKTVVLVDTIRRYIGRFEPMLHRSKHPM